MVSRGNVGNMDLLTMSNDKMVVIRGGKSGSYAVTVCKMNLRQKPHGGHGQVFCDSYWPASSLSHHTGGGGGRPAGFTWRARWRWPRTREYPLVLRRQLLTRQPAGSRTLFTPRLEERRWFWVDSRLQGPEASRKAPPFSQAATAGRLGPGSPGGRVGPARPTRKQPNP